MILNMYLRNRVSLTLAHYVNTLPFGLLITTISISEKINDIMYHYYLCNGVIYKLTVNQGVKWVARMNYGR